MPPKFIPIPDHQIRSQLPSHFIHNNRWHPFQASLIWPYIASFPGPKSYGGTHRDQVQLLLIPQTCPASAKSPNKKFATGTARSPYPRLHPTNPIHSHSPAPTNRFIRLRPNLFRSGSFDIADSTGFSHDFKILLRLLGEKPHAGKGKTAMRQNFSFQIHSLIQVYELPIPLRTLYHMSHNLTLRLKNHSHSHMQRFCDPTQHTERMSLVIGRFQTADLLL